MFSWNKPKLDLATNSTRMLQPPPVRDILQLTSHAMLRAVRVVLANGSLVEARDLQQMLKKAISQVEEDRDAIPNRKAV